MSIRNALLSAAILAAIAPAASAQQELTKRATVLPDVTVEVSNVQGSVEVSTWDRNEVELVAELESSKDELEFEATDRHVRIEVDRPQGKYHSDEDDANLTLRVPKGARLIVDTVSADITVNGVRGEQSLQSVSGTVETQAFDAPVSLTAVSGEVIVAGSGGKAAVTTENVSGTITASGIRGNFQGEVVSGNIDATVAAAERLSVSSVSGDISVKRGPDTGGARGHGIGQRHDRTDPEAAGQRRFRHRILQRRHRELLRSEAARHEQVHAGQRAQLHPGQRRRARRDPDALRRNRGLRPLI